jgi:hypothetical protein
MPLSAMYHLLNLFTSAGCRLLTSILSPAPKAAIVFGLLWCHCYTMPRGMERRWGDGSWREWI